MSETKPQLFTPPPPSELEIGPPAKPSQLAADLRTEAVAELLSAAYAKASTLELLPDERTKLIAPFPDEAVRQREDDGNLYIEHAFIRERLLEVFGPGGFSEVPRRIWGEDFVTLKGKPATRLYADVVLLIRGCYVGEAIGAGEFYKNNPKSDYSQAAESAQSEAVKRIGAKKLGIGLQVWKHSWCEGWKARHKKQPERPQFDERTRTPIVQEPIEATFTKKVSSLDTKMGPSGKPYRIVQFEGDPRHFTTWHEMQAVAVGDEIKVVAVAIEKDGRTHWNITSYWRIEKAPEGEI